MPPWRSLLPFGSRAFPRLGARAHTPGQHGLGGQPARSGLSLAKAKRDLTWHGGSAVARGAGTRPGRRPLPRHPPERRWASRPRVILAERQRIDGLTLTGAFRSWGWWGPRRRPALLGLHPLALRN